MNRDKISTLFFKLTIPKFNFCSSFLVYSCISFNTRTDSCNLGQTQGTEQFSQRRVPPISRSSLLLCGQTLPWLVLSPQGSASSRMSWTWNHALCHLWPHTFSTISWDLPISLYISVVFSPSPLWRVSYCIFFPPFKEVGLFPVFGK